MKLRTRHHVALAATLFVAVAFVVGCGDSTKLPEGTKAGVPTDKQVEKEKRLFAFRGG
jgi:hypothetical protein